MCACHRVVFHTDVHDVVWHCLTIQFCMTTISKGLAYCQKDHVVFQAMRVIFLFGCPLAAGIFLLVPLNNLVSIWHLGF